MPLTVQFQEGRHSVCPDTTGRNACTDRQFTTSLISGRMNAKTDEPKPFILFTLVLARVAGLTMTAPVYGTSDVPLQVRALLAAALALLVAPSQWQAAVAHAGSPVQYLVLLGGEAADRRLPGPGRLDPHPRHDAGRRTGRTGQRTFAGRGVRSRRWTKTSPCSRG